MNALFQLISHEYRKYIFTRGFLLLLLVFPLAAAFGLFASIVTDKAAPIRHFVVLDETGRYEEVIDRALIERRLDEEIRAWDAYAEMAVKPAEDGTFPLEAPFAPEDINDSRREAFKAAGGSQGAYSAARPYLREGVPPPDPARPRFLRDNLPPEAASQSSTETRIEALLPYLTGKQKLADGSALFAVLVIPANFDEEHEVTFWTSNLIAQDLRGFVDRALTRSIRDQAFVAEGVDISIVERIGAMDVSTQAVKADADGAEHNIVSAIRTALPLVLAYALFVLINAIGGMLLTNTVEEKSNKIVELLLSSVSATQLMLGKLIGLALVGITLPALLVGILFLGITAGTGGEMTPEMAELVAAVREGLFGSPIVPLFFLYFVLGYLFYASIYLAVGALSSTIQDAQSFVTPLTILLLIPLPFLQIIVQDPNGLFARIFTFIPIYTPYAVMLRISSQPPLWEIAAATGVLLLVVGYLMVTMGRIYRNGVLSGGGAPSWKEFLKHGRK